MKLHPISGGVIASRGKGQLPRTPNHILKSRIVWRRLDALQPFPGNPRQHPEKQLAALARSIERFGVTNPVLIDETGTILAGHARIEVAKRLDLATVPTLTMVGLSEAEKKALVIADNRLPEQAVWEIELLRNHFQALIDIDFDVELTGFSTGEIDLMIDGTTLQTGADPDDAPSQAALSGPAVSCRGDIWDLGRHRIVCADARDVAAYRSLLKGEVAQMVFTDPPYNVPIAGHAMGRGRIRHREFTQASGEMSPEAFAKFLTEAMRHASRASADGAIQFWCMDWRHLSELGAAAKACGLEHKNLVVWVKTNAGQGSFYRSQHELIAVYKKGAAKHINNFGLGDKGRYRTNVWSYPGVNSLHPARRGDLALHPTTKPVALTADAIRDCSKRNGLILDPFGGSGTTILAAERTGRVARLVELDPLYVDVAVRRWQLKTGVEARDSESGVTFDELAKRRHSERADYKPSRDARRHSERA